MEASYAFNDQCSHHIETSQLIWSGKQLTGFYVMGTLVIKKLANLYCKLTSFYIV